MIEVERRDASGLKREVWRFELLLRTSVNIPEICLDVYLVQKRITKRCGWFVDTGIINGRTTKLHYNRILKRESGLNIEEVPLPDDVAAEAKQIIVDVLTVKKIMST